MTMIRQPAEYLGCSCALCGVALSTTDVLADHHVYEYGELAYIELAHADCAHADTTNPPGYWDCD